MLDDSRIFVEYVHAYSKRKRMCEQSWEQETAVLSTTMCKKCDLKGKIEFLRLNSICAIQIWKIILCIRFKMYGSSDIGKHAYITTTIKQVYNMFHNFLKT